MAPLRCVHTREVVLGQRRWRLQLALRRWLSTLLVPHGACRPLRRRHVLRRTQATGSWGQVQFWAKPEVVGRAGGDSDVITVTYHGHAACMQRLCRGSSISAAAAVTAQRRQPAVLPHVC